MGTIHKLPKRKLALNTIYCADNLEVMKQMPGESIDLIYIDPPFCTQAVKKSKAWDDEVQTGSFDDRWGGGINSYILWLVVRLREMHRLLKPTGSLFVHLDHRAIHYIKIELDKIFGLKNFHNEIIWKRGTPRGNAGKKYAVLSDHILFYSKGSSYCWNTQYGKYQDGYIKKRYNQLDKKTGKYFQPTSLLGHRGVNPVREWRGVSKHWRYPLKRLDELDKKGLIYWPPRGGVPRYKRFADDQKGMPLCNIWDDIPPVNSQALEQLGYPTQKPSSKTFTI